MALLDKDRLRKVHLFGIDLTDDNGNEYPDELWDEVLDAGDRMFRTMFGVPIGGEDYEEVLNERHGWDRGGNQMLRLYQGPVREITALDVYNGTQRIAQLPPAWACVLNADFRSVQIVPVGTAGVPFQNIIPTIGLAPRKQIAPLAVSYKAGYKTSDVPAIIRMLVGLYAAHPVLITAGDLILGAGIASISTSIDGMSESLGSTSSATNSGYGSRIIENRKLIEKYEQAVSNMVGSISFAVA